MAYFYSVRLATQFKVASLLLIEIDPNVFNDNTVSVAQLNGPFPASVLSLVYHGSDFHLCV